MIFAIKVPKSTRKNAAPAFEADCLKRNVDNSEKNRACAGGFTLLELMVVIIIIGILAALAYSSLMELIFTNRAKETAQTMRTFAERALAEGKRQNKPVEIKVVDENIQYSIDDNVVSEALSGGFTGNGDNYTIDGVSESFNKGIESKIRLGLSGISDEGYFIACGAKNYCAAAVKSKSKNSFVAHIKKGNSANWEAL